MSEKRRGLGRGLGALIPNTPPKAAGDRAVDDILFGSGSKASEASSGTATVTLERPVTEAAPDGEPAPEVQVSSWSEGIELPGSSPAAVEPETDGLLPVPGARFAEIPVEAIRPNAKQPREVFDEEELAELVLSIREIGVLQPIVVRQLSEADAADGVRFELVMGERRWRATQAAGLAAIPAIVRETSDDAMLRDALLENLHRSQLNPLEEAAAYQQLLDDFGCTHEELAGRIGRSRPQISNTIRLLRLPPQVARRLAAGVLSAGHARALLGLEDSGSMEALAQRIVSEGLSVRAVEEVVALGDATTSAVVKKRPRPGARSSELDDLAARLGDQLDTKVAINLGQRKGRLTIDFASVDDLNRIIALMGLQVRGAFSAEPGDQA